MAVPTATPSFQIKRHDTAPFLRVQCLDSNGGTVSVAGSTLRFHMQDLSGRLVVNDGGSHSFIIDGPNGIIEYRWQPADVANSGQFLAEFEVTLADGTIETFPDQTNISVEIKDDLA